MVGGTFTTVSSGGGGLLQATANTTNRKKPESILIDFLVAAKIGKLLFESG
jgi:hypothetical protein